MRGIEGFQSVITRHRNRMADDRVLQRAAARGDMVRLRSGASVPAAVWKALGPEDRRRLEVAAAAEMHSGCIASHRSAAVLWGVPSISPHDGVVHARVSAASGSRTEHGVRKHAVKDVDLHLTAVEGVRCTTLERTVLDLAATEPFAEAVVAVDWALGVTSKDRLLRTLVESDPVRGRRRMEGVIDFSDGRSGSAGESWSRAQIAEGGLVIPVLQQAFSDSDGLIGYVDFWWPEQNRIGEFDGLMKYKEASLLKGRSPGDVVAAEKIREDRLRATASSPGVDRWIWDTLRQPGALVRRLTAVGIPRHREYGRVPTKRA